MKASDKLRQQEQFDRMAETLRPMEKALAQVEQIVMLWERDLPTLVGLRNRLMARIESKPLAMPNWCDLVTMDSGLERIQ